MAAWMGEERTENVIKALIHPLIILFIHSFIIANANAFSFLVKQFRYKYIILEINFEIKREREWYEGKMCIYLQFSTGFSVILYFLCCCIEQQLIKEQVEMTVLQIYSRVDLLTTRVKRETVVEYSQGNKYCTI